MENMLWDHVRGNPEIDKQLVSCANTLEAASPEVIWAMKKKELPPDDVSKPVRI